MAIHILEGGNVSHCPIHDLESITYLGLWTAAHIVKRENRSETVDSEMMLFIIEKLRPKNNIKLRLCAAIKRMLLKEWENRSDWSIDEAEEIYHGAFAPFTEILCKLAKLGRRWYEKSLDHEDNSTMFTPDEIEQAFAEYLDVYERYMPTEQTWDYLQGLKIRERKS